MKHFFTSLCLALALLPAALSAQTVPAMPAAPPANLQGAALRDWYRTNWYDGKRTVLDYGTARGRMYNYVDNFNNKVTCVYSGYAENVPYSASSTNTGVVNDINCEHTIPQSWFNEVTRMRSDIHHLYPTRIQWNSDRGSDPFADIPDATTTGWLRGTTRLTSIPTSNIDEYSEDTNAQFEPREDHKGNLARSAFYFYTVHANENFDASRGVITALADLATLYRWHLADPVDAHEIERNNRVAAVQGNFNPYIAYPATVATAWGFAPAGSAFSFATATGSLAEGNTGTSTYTFTLNLSAAATAATTIQVNASVNSTATSGTDFTFASPTIVTFPAGSTTQTVTLTVTGDTQPEADETVVLTLTNPSTGNSVGTPTSHTLTITNDDGQAPTLAFAAAAGSLAEGNTGTATYTANVTLTNASSLTFPITVPVTVDAAGTTATSPTDYTLNTTTLTFASATALTQPVTVTVVGDLAYEPSETVRLLLGTPSSATIIAGPSAHILTIVNDEAAPAGAPCTKPYFSQYIESGTNNTKVLEIFNPTTAPMPLAGKSVALYANGVTAAPTATLQLTGTLAPGDVYVIVNSGVTDAAVAAQADVQSNVGFFNGDDAIVLLDGTDTLDVIGVVGQRPTEWTVPNGSTLNNTLVRLPNVSQGGRWNGPYGSATWSALGTDNYTGVGSYTSTACAIVTGTRTAAVRRNTLEIYPNPATTTVQLRLPGLLAAQPATVAVLDMLGRPVRQRTAKLSATEAAQLDLRGLPAGIYAVRVTCADIDYTGRVVVQ
ncbi:endonuclease [Hymenobacter sp. BT683]|uniref:Endonuclease n=1 Tax=Hymenobacter jeongseonensis TaxID=2791027 RepID=A0ABS0INF6_9BACT|nr:endonuclease [Hymenobacter jeongseonensis]MBF9239912.1 endonuclease [Hymenobacter jeongseonensis]